MSWKDNRRRKRVWYEHYRRVCERLLKMFAGNQEVAAEALAYEFFRLYEAYHLHGRRRIARSAEESLMLAIRDVGLNDFGVAGKLYISGSRPALPGQNGQVI